MNLITSEKINNLASALYHIIFSIGIIGGGYWAYYQFDRLQKVDNAFLEKANLEIQNQQFKNLINEFPAVKITIKPSIIKTKRSEVYFLKVDATLENNGASSVRLNFEEDSFSITPVHFTNRSTPKYGKPIVFPMPASDAPSKRINALTLRPNHSRDLTTVLKVDKPGFYLVKFYSHQSPKEEKKLFERFGMPKSPEFRGVRCEV